MSAQPVVMVIPPRAVSRLFGACVNAPEGAAPPSMFDFDACFTIGMGNRSVNQITRAQNNGVLSDFPGGPTADEKKRQEQFEDYLRQLWLSRMSEEYQRAYKDMMMAIEDAEKFCDRMERELEEKREIVDREMDRILQNAVKIGREEFIPDGRGGYMDRYGKPRNSSNTRPEVLAEVDRRYKQEPWRLDALSDAQDWIKAKEDLEKLERENNLFKRDLQGAKTNKPESVEETQKIAEGIKRRQETIERDGQTIDEAIKRAQEKGVKLSPERNPAFSNASSYGEGDIDTFDIEASKSFNKATMNNEGGLAGTVTSPEPIYPVKGGDASRLIKPLYGQQIDL